ncbi:transposase family protein [Streptomyces sp. NPDC093509]|uniref:transposase family protein n=1 Tax=Streptomyces sp. NPDC093509 TaxID=3154982 RepID=UPI00344FF28B
MLIVTPARDRCGKLPLPQRAFGALVYLRKHETLSQPAAGFDISVRRAARTTRQCDRPPGSPSARPAEDPVRARTGLRADSHDRSSLPVVFSLLGSAGQCSGPWLSGRVTASPGWSWLRPR